MDAGTPAPAGGGSQFRVAVRLIQPEWAQYALQKGKVMSSKRKDDPAEMARMVRWLEAVCEEVGVDPSVIDPVQAPMLDLIRQIAHGPSRPGGPMTSYIIGIAAAEQGKPAPELVQQVSELIETYTDPED